MSPEESAADYLFYIGAGAVAAGGFISLARFRPSSARSAPASRPAPPRRRARPTADRARHADEGRRLRHRRARADPHAAPSSRSTRLGRGPDRALRVPLRHGLEPHHRRDRLVSNPISGMTVARAHQCLLFVLSAGPASIPASALSHRGDRLRGGLNGGTTCQDLKTGFPGRRHAPPAADRDPGRGADLGGRHRLDAFPVLEQHLAPSSPPEPNTVPPTGPGPSVSTLTEDEQRDLAFGRGPQYKVWRVDRAEIEGAHAGQVPGQRHGQGPRLSGTSTRRSMAMPMPARQRPAVMKFDAPKATLMAPGMTAS